jgi:hypothetical protein
VLLSARAQRRNVACVLALLFGVGIVAALFIESLFVSSGGSIHQRTAGVRVTGHVSQPRLQGTGLSGVNLTFDEVLLPEM